ncbi:2-amino-4-hydroxy-6-hydroxymethyldihydropteridine diphosphokinase [Paludibacter sp.]|uniref:2-amino-4-hydroxy-6- hydroxymethyldihydropteridine diphosphokinase n=1 Tax=Paludibacter sp. TaxID=1898105 RepID=UPI001352457B|nr:2-amino-4-hydroxy-6-hydroxymethyldihydropteridine diphosphokinase [Paludibacter sp.]MTK54538.1 2-amino-4-hydroxy-6-hydroxymethyldihydropteridine diphosphokinase [Paludibacter sp.]
MSKVYLSLGSNLGDKQRNLSVAISEIEQRCGKVELCSSFYSTPPWGFNSNNEFVNLALSITTTLEPLDLLNVLKHIEQVSGRQQKAKSGYEDRPLDIDILFYDNSIINSETLTVPHPRLHLRLFVLVPMNEIAPQLIHPIFHKTIETLLMECNDSTQICKI